MKPIVIVALLAVGGILAWNNIPALRTAFSKAKDSATSWSVEDRKEDPIGYVKYARGKLESNIAKYEAVLGEVNGMKKANADKAAEFANKEKAATDFTNDAKERFATANANNEWPITWMENTYTKDQFITQVNTWLAEKSNASKQIASYQANVDSITAKSTEIRNTIQDLKGKVDDLNAKEANLKVASLTEADTQLLADVDALLNNTTEKLAGDPIRGLDEAMAMKAKSDADAAAKADKDAATSAALDFLNS